MNARGEQFAQGSSGMRAVLTCGADGAYVTKIWGLVMITDLCYFFSLPWVSI